MSFFRSVSKIYLDEVSWLESFSPEERLYCENGRQLLVHLDFRNSKTVIVSLPRNWGTTSREATIDEAHLELIGSKIKRYFASEGHVCVVENYDPGK